jgi:hypothetical protein
MAELHTAELKRLGVPFFGVKESLILSNDEESTMLEGDLEPQLSQTASGKVTKQQILALQRKMLNHLVELYGD